MSSSPPTSVHARPGDLTDLIVLFGDTEAEIVRTPRYFSMLFGVTMTRLSRGFSNSDFDDLAANLRDLALEVTNARFARVVTNDVAHRGFGNLEFWTP